MALAAGAFSLTSSAAFADETVPPTKPGDSGVGSITVYKYEQPDEPLSETSDGSELPAEALENVKPIAGVGFTVCRVGGIDLTKAADWTRLANLTVTLDGEGKAVVTETVGGASTVPELDCTVATDVTDDDGRVRFDALAADFAYVVYESAPPSNAVDVAQPALLTIPYPGTSDEKVWNYDPVIYPKNTLVGSGATKNGKIIGNKVTYDIAVPINPLAPGKTYFEFTIEDALSEDLQYTSSRVTLTTKDGVKLELVDGVDYTLEHKESDEANVSGTVTFTMGESGLKLLDANLHSTLVLTIDADAIDSGTTANTAHITINGITGDTKIDEPENFWKNAHITKLANNRGATENVPLAGATFDIYAVGDDVTDCGTEPIKDTTKVFGDQRSADDGRTPNQVLAEGWYCAYETAVPAGYKGDPNGVLLHVTAEDATAVVVNDQIGTDDGDLPFLPLTGSTGSMLLLGGGAAILAVGVVLFLVSRRRRSQAEAATTEL